MPLIGFNVFREKLLSGQKTQTIRKFRKKPIKLGDGWIQLWKLLTPQQLDELIQRDGFENADEMLKFFITHYPLSEVFQVIRWNKN